MFRLKLMKRVQALVPALKQIFLNVKGKRKKNAKEIGRANERQIEMNRSNKDTDIGRGRCTEKDVFMEIVICFKLCGFLLGPSISS